MTRHSVPLQVTSDAFASKTSMLDVQFAQLSDTGLVRAHNEDFLGSVLPATPEEAREKGWLFGLADGVGGQDRGEVASQMTIETLTEGFRATRSGDPLAGVLPKLIERANLAVYETAMGMGPGGSSMATTVVACGLRYDRAVVAHVGDSRCYLVRHGRAICLTKDHTVPAEQLRMGLISVQDAAKAGMGNLLSRSVGSGMFVNVEVEEHQIYTNDFLLLCSDGLHNSVKEADLEKALRDGVKLDDAASSLVELARKRDGRDNISVQVIRVTGVERVGMYRGRQYKIR